MPTDDRKERRALAEELAKTLEDLGHMDMRAEELKAIEAFAARVRREAIEECAKVAEDYHEAGSERCGHVKTVSARIRRLEVECP